MRIAIFIVLLCISFSSKAQTNPTALWLRHTCGYTNGVNLLGGNVWGDAVCADRFGNSYNAGAFSGYWFTMDTIIEMNENRFYINKFNAQGQRLWTAKAKGTTINSIMTPTKMECDSIGNLYVCGTFSVDDSVYMAPFWYPIGSGFVAKYDSNGNNIWCQFVPRTGTTTISFSDMSLTNDHIYICGNMGFGTQSFGSYTFINTQSQNGVLAKLDFDGNILAAEQLDPNSVNEVFSIEASKHTNNVFLVGQHISSNLSLDGMSLSHTIGATNSFIIKMNDALVAEWFKKAVTYLHPNQTIGFSIPCLKKIELDQLDNIYTTANGNGDSTVVGNLSFNHRVSPNGSYAQDIYMIKLNSGGQEVWMRNGGSDEMDHVNDIITDKWGNSILSVYSGSQSVSGLIFGNDTIQQWHGGLVKFDTNGNLLYTQKLQEARSIKSLAWGIDSTFYGTGTGFNPVLPYINLSVPDCEDPLNGYYNPPYKMIMAKFYDSSGDFTLHVEETIQNPNDIKVYPNPTSGIFRVDFESDHAGGFYYYISDMMGAKIFENVTNTNFEVNLSDLSPGIYFLTLSNLKIKKTVKIIKA